MKKATAFFLALVMVLSLCSVTAFAEDEITSITLSAAPLTVEQLKGLTGMTNLNLTVIDSTPDNDKLQEKITVNQYQLLDENCNYLYACNVYKEDVAAENYWFDIVNSIDLTGQTEKINFDSVKKVRVVYQIGNDPETPISFDSSATVTVSGVTFDNSSPANYYITTKNYYEIDGVLNVCLILDVEGAEEEEPCLPISICSLIKNIVKTVFCLNKVIVKHTADAASAFKDIVSNIKFKF